MTEPLDDARGELLATIAKIDHLLEREEHDSGYAAFVYMRRIWPQLKQLAAPVPQCEAEPWDAGEHEGCGIDSERAVKRWKDQRWDAGSVEAIKARLPTLGIANDLAECIGRYMSETDYRSRLLPSAAEFVANRALSTDPGTVAVASAYREDGK